MNQNIAHPDAPIEPATPSGRSLEALVQTIVSELDRIDPAPPYQFAFKWRGHPVMARVDAAPSGIRLAVDATLCNIPFTAENKEQRDLLLRLTRDNNGIDGPRLTVERSAFGLSIETAWTGPAPAGKVLGHVVEILCLSASYAGEIECLCLPASA